jgi:hypothetical protein
MKKEKGLALLVISVVFLSLMTMAYAAVDKSDAVSGGALTVGTAGSLTETSAGSYAAQGGNVTDIDIDTTASTVKWAGFFGEVTTSLKLGVSSDVLYDFGNAANDQIKTVLASTDSSFDFSQLQNASAADVDTVWSFTTADIDSATSAYTETATIATVTSVDVLNLTAYTSTGVLNNTLYRSGILADTASPSAENDFVFGVAVDDGERDFSNSTIVDYELVVPVSGGAIGTLETYYFFLDIE